MDAPAHLAEGLCSGVSMLAALKVVGRAVLQFLLCGIFGYILSILAAIIWLLIAMAAFGNLDQALEQLPKTPVYLQMSLSYFATTIACGVAVAVAGLLRLGSQWSMFWKSVRREMIPSGMIALGPGIACGFGFAYWFGKSDAGLDASIAGGVVIGILSAVSWRLFLATRLWANESDG
jgi:hypothetical protein